MTTKSEPKATERRTSTRARSSAAKSDEKPTTARTSKSGTASRAKSSPRTGGTEKPAARSTTTRATAKPTGSAAKPATAKSAAPRTASKSAAAKTAKPRRARSAAETEKIRLALNERLVELVTEYDSMMAELNDLQRDRLGDSAGDDQADTGTKTFEREQEISLANGIRDRVTQVERALERLDDGHYGYCERCGNPIPAERLAAFPSVTLCVTCKQLEERR
jgi:RNA polymerase-binding transcription factor